jgi:hypothetical protein
MSTTNFKIFNNPNKIISKLPFKIVGNKTSKSCNGTIGNQIKTKLIEPIYLNPIPEDIIQTFLYLFNNNEGKGIFVNIINNKIKDWVIFNNTIIITKIDEIIIKELYKTFTSILKTNNKNISLMFFINLGSYPVIKKTLYIEDKKKMIPVVSFTSSFIHYDIALPIPKIIDWSSKITQGILFIFEEVKIKNIESTSNKIYQRILELRKHPFYKNFNLNFIIIDQFNLLDKINLFSTMIVISDPYVPIFYQYFLNANIHMVLIENYNYYSYWSNLLNKNTEYTSWNINTWEQSLDNYVYDKKITKNLAVWSKNHYSKDNINNKYYGFLEHLNQNYSNIELFIEPFSNYTEANFNITTQLDYDKFFDLLYKNYKMIRCWSYRLNPYSTLLNKLRTNHNFVPEFIKLSLTSLPVYENIHWISSRRALLDFIPEFLKKSKSIEFKEKPNIKTINNYIVENSEELVGMNIINNNSSVFYIELAEKSSKFNLWENEFLSDFETILQFINNQPLGSSFIIKIYTFQLPRTINLIKNFQNKFEKIKIIKNEWFDSYLPYRYLIGINYVKEKTKSEKIILDLETYNHMFFSLETQELIKIIKYIKSDVNVDPLIFKNYELINEWISKWFDSKYI